ncbi:MAG: trypsin-like peptidase domain-containing protein [Candidatus Sungbacteria bacterium]|uniref:Trypsin-like peptidase domain-containing protein n=1 Tax=Candidatus Sungiibacteriota bacterium TaxID=2750080 RepID=A0A9D6QYQ7_9BACT|nr:trypsin-like peptidase domain-containing protein [Candidatus Sungbacteria bacterium]
MTHEESIIEAIKKALPAVVSIVIGKDSEALLHSIPESMWQEIEREAKDEHAATTRSEIIRHMPKTDDGKVRVGFGSGFLVSREGYILTNKHVVIDADAEYTVLTAANDTYTAKVLARDPLNDVAILKIEANNVPSVELGNSDDIKLGQSVVALGNALGEFQNTVSAGIVSGLSRFITAMSDDEHHAEHLRGLIQTDAAINPGNSGGPLVNLAGEVIAINSAIAQGAQNIGFAIPINRAKKDLASVMKFGKLKKPFLGIRYVPINDFLKEKLHLSTAYGILIRGEHAPEHAGVVKGSPAAEAGIREKDIILSVNGKPLDEKNILEEVLETSEIGDRLTFKVLRGSDPEFETSAVLAERK